MYKNYIIQTKGGGGYQPSPIKNYKLELWMKRILSFQTFLPRNKNSMNINRNKNATIQSVYKNLYNIENNIMARKCYNYFYENVI